MLATWARRGSRNILAAGFGNALEWYDFGVYGFFAVVIARKFFPSDDDFASLLSAFGAFALGYLARPLGAVLLGHLGDRWGRRPVLLLSIGLVGSATFSIGLLPTFDQAGELAPLLLVLLRLVQGFAVAGEYSGSTVYLIERAPAERRGLDSSWSLFGQYVGILTGSGLAALVTSLLTETQLYDWGWRLPFLLSLVFAACGFLLRWQVPESPAMTDAQAERRANPLTVVLQEWRTIGAFVAILAMSGGGLAPLLAAYLVHRTENDFTPAIVIIALAAISLIATLRFPDRTGEALR